MPCPTSPNQVAIDQSKFWDSNGIHWTSHRIGWAVAGGCAVLVCYCSLTRSITINLTPTLNDQTTIISLISILQHCRYFEQFTKRYMGSLNNRQELHHSRPTTTNVRLSIIGTPNFLGSPSRAVYESSTCLPFMQ